MKLTVLSKIKWVVRLFALAALSSPGMAQTIVSLQPVAELGSVAPGTGGNTWRGIVNDASVGSDGSVSFAASITRAPSNPIGMWSGSPGSLTLSNLAGDTPSTLPGFTYGTLDNVHSATGGVGLAYLRLDGTIFSAWSFTAGVPTLLGRVGGAVPGIPGETFSQFSNFTTNDSGQFATVGRATGTPSLRTIHFYTGAALELFVLQGTSTGIAAGDLAGSSFSTFGLTPATNNLGVTAFASAVTGSTATQMLAFSANPIAGAPTVVAMNTGVAPGAGFAFATFPNFLINDNSDVLFKATLGGAAPANANLGLWFNDSGVTSLVAIEDASAPGAPAGTEFSDFTEIFLPNTGGWAFVANVRNAAEVAMGKGVWVDADGTGASPLELVALEGGTALNKDGVTPLPGTIQTINNVTMARDGTLFVLVTMSTAPTKVLLTRPVGAAELTVAYLATGDVIYDESRTSKSITAITIPEKNLFVALGGGPVGRQNMVNSSGQPLVSLSLDSAAAGLFFPTTGALTYLVAVADDSAPGTVGSTFESIRSSGTLNENGLGAFRGFLELGDTVAGTNEQGIWAELPDPAGGAPILTLVARRGDSAPGGGTFTDLSVNPMFNVNNQVAFSAEIAGGPFGTTGIYAGEPGSLTRIQAGGSGSPILPVGVVFDSARAGLALNDSLQVATTLPLQTDTTLGVTRLNDSVVVRLGSAPRLIAREGSSSATGTAVFDDVRLATGQRVYINNTGRVVFPGKRRISVADGITAANQFGIWFHNGTVLSVIAAGHSSGFSQPAPGIAGATFLKPTSPVLNDLNRIAFLSTIQGPGVDSTNNNTLYLSNSTTSTLLVRTGQAQSTGFGPQGVDPAATFNSIGGPALGNVGSVSHVAFTGGLTVGLGGVTASTDTGVWSHNSTVARLVAREGAFAPDGNGAATTAVFSAFTVQTISQSGRVAFVGDLLIGTGGVTAANDKGLWAENSSGDLVLVSREGQVFTVPIAGGGTRNATISAFSIPGTGGTGGANVYKSFTGEGYLLAHITFTDGTTGSFVFLVP